jgi:eukaryotic-like serine/threonine-protein kinase
MKQNRFLIKLLAITVLFYGCSKSSTTDVTPAPVVNTDTDNLVFIGAANKKMYAVDAEKGTKVWEYATIGQIFSSPTVDNNVVYFGSDSLVYGLDAKTGISKWVYDKNVRRSIIQSSPLIVNGNIFFGTYNYDNGFLNLDFFKGISIADKQIRASRVVTNSKGSAGIISSSTYSNGSLFFGSYDKNIYAVSEDGGAKLWTYLTRNAIYSSPLVKSAVLYVGGLDGYFYAIDAVSGSLKWEVNVKSPIYASPIEKDGIIYFASDEGKVYALNASNGSIKWQSQIGSSIISSPSINGTTLIIGGGLDKNIVCLNLSDGSSNWKTPLSSATASSPTVSNGNVYIGDNGGNLYAINATTGTIKWTYASMSVFNSSSPCVLTNQGKVAVSSINGAN